MFLSPEKIIEYCGVYDGQKVADFGAGSGYWSFLLAKRVHSTGKVYAIDVQKDWLIRLKNDAEKLKLDNIEVVLADIEESGGIHLASGLVDWVFLVNTLFATDNRPNVVREARRILKPGGKIFLIDWVDSFGGLGPHKNHVITPTEAEWLFLDNGFNKEKDFPAGDHHYGIIFSKKNG